MFWFKTIGTRGRLYIGHTGANVNGGDGNFYYF
jgi:hypothetical protein